MKRIILMIWLAATVSGAWAQDDGASVENEAVSRYLSEVCYEDMADTSRVAAYCGGDASQHLDWPAAVAIAVPAVYKSYADRGQLSLEYSPERSFSSSSVVTLEQGQQAFSIFNLTPRQSCFYRLKVNMITTQTKELLPEGQLRMIRVPSVTNVRDMGGWLTADGRRVRYGRLYRGGELNGLTTADTADLQLLLSLGIGAEIDLRSWYEEMNGVSAFGFLKANEVAVGTTPTFLATSSSGQLPEHLTQYAYLYRWRQAFQFIVANLKEGRAVYQHCRHGADRTGYLSLLLEGLLGVGYDGLVKDYELTSFSGTIRGKEAADEVIAFIMTLDGSTLQEQFNTFFVDRVGVSQGDIDWFRSEMLEDYCDDDTTVGISSQSSSHSLLPAAAYDLQGRRLATPPVKGLYVEGGKVHHRR